MDTCFATTVSRCVCTSCGNFERNVDYVESEERCTYKKGWVSLLRRWVKGSLHSRRSSLFFVSCRAGPASYERDLSAPVVVMGKWDE